MIRSRITVRGGRDREDGVVSATGPDVFDKTLQTTNDWLNDLTEELGPDRQLCWNVLSIVLQMLRDRCLWD